MCLHKETNVYSNTYKDGKSMNYTHLELIGMKLNNGVRITLISFNYTKLL